MTEEITSPIEDSEAVGAATTTETETAASIVSVLMAMPHSHITREGATLTLTMVDFNLLIIKKDQNGPMGTIITKVKSSGSNSGRAEEETEVAWACLSEHEGALRRLAPILWSAEECHAAEET